MRRIIKIFAAILRRIMGVFTATSIPQSGKNADDK
ncbi:MAG: hypothetical protein RLZZ252_1143, partial [Bacteroidota bacterium]